MDPVAQNKFVLRSEPEPVLNAIQKILEKFG